MTQSKLDGHAYFLRAEHKKTNYLCLCKMKEANKDSKIIIFLSRFSEQERESVEVSLPYQHLVSMYHILTNGDISKSADD